MKPERGAPYVWQAITDVAGVSEVSGADQHGCSAV